MPTPPESSLSLFGWGTQMLGHESPTPQLSMRAGSTASSIPNTTAIPEWTSKRPTPHADTSGFIAESKSVVGQSVPIPEVPPVKTEHSLAIPVLALIWVMGVLLLAIRWIRANRQFHYWIHHEKKLQSSDIRNVFEECCTQCRIRREIQLLVTDRVESPAVFGILRPKLLIPVKMLPSFSKDEWRMVFFSRTGAHPPSRSLDSWDYFRTPVAALVQPLGLVCRSTHENRARNLM